MQTHIFVLGFVQGVGYRYFVKKKATELGLTGWVKNLPDERVEILVQGKKENIQKLIELCEKGPFFSEVKSVQVEQEEQIDKFNSFEILH